jgi:hypothetical protein
MTAQFPTPTDAPVPAAPSRASAHRGPSKLAKTAGAVPRYNKALAAFAVGAIGYLQVYGATWHQNPALSVILVALGVLGIPNAPKP